MESQSPILLDHVKLGWEVLVFGVIVIRETGEDCERGRGPRIIVDNLFESLRLSALFNNESFDFRSRSNNLWLNFCRTLLPTPTVHTRSPTWSGTRLYIDIGIATLRTWLLGGAVGEGSLGVETHGSFHHTRNPLMNPWRWG